MTERYVHFHRYSMGPEEKEAVLDALDSGWITKGPKVAQFEQDFCSYTGASHALALNSCTAGLHLAMMALKIQPGDEVITTPLTFVATVNMIVYLGATPVLADVDPQSLNISSSSVASKITDRTRAILPVHLAGQPCDLEPLLQLAQQHKLWVIDDAAHAIGASYRGKMIGEWCDATAFSFYATKNITTGEGGMLTSPHAELIEAARPLSLHGLSKDAWKRYSAESFQHYLVEAPGFKYNMNDIQAALGLAQLKKCDAFTEKRRQRSHIYRRELENLPLRFQEEIPHIQHAHHLFPIILETGALRISRDEFLTQLQAQGVGCAVHFVPIFQHPFYQKMWPRAAQDLAVSAEIGQHMLSLPLYPALSETDQNYVIETVQTLCKRYQR